MLAWRLFTISRSQVNNTILYKSKANKNTNFKYYRNVATTNSKDQIYVIITRVCCITSFQEFENQWRNEQP